MVLTNGGAAEETDSTKRTSMRQQTLPTLAPPEATTEKEPVVGICGGGGGLAGGKLLSTTLRQGQPVAGLCWNLATVERGLGRGEERAWVAIEAGDGAAERLPEAAKLLAAAVRPNGVADAGSERLEARTAAALGARREGELGAQESSGSGGKRERGPWGRHLWPQKAGSRLGRARRWPHGVAAKRGEEREKWGACPRRIPREGVGESNDQVRMVGTRVREWEVQERHNQRHRGNGGCRLE
ncbi:hypothetical protein E2562_025509 [Oryza meyeriana var. granulata]|uniref:Uncharacterized protein n=1 Tax=Oryza meyeriana var. granulata TaxID=110450 RepID=A0A6G1C8M6_9ORYZ|nr:hypothetical protein E2562_025509 [Oryza meyeriana var. granulata]